MGACCGKDADAQLAASAAPDGNAPQEIGLHEVTTTTPRARPLETASAPGPPTTPTTPGALSEAVSDEEDDDDSTVSAAEREEREEFRNMACTEKRVRYEFDTDVDEKDVVELSFVLEGAAHVVPDDKTILASSNGIFVRIRVYDCNGHRRRGKIETRADKGSHGAHVFNMRVVVENAIVTDVIKFSVYRSYLLETARHKVGRTLVSVQDLKEHHEMPELWLFSGLGVPIFDRKMENPTTLCLRAIQARQRAPMLSPQQFALSVGNFAASEGATASSESASIRREAKEARANRSAESAADEDGTRGSESKAVAAQERAQMVAEDHNAVVNEPDDLSESSKSSISSRSTAKSAASFATILSGDLEEEEHGSKAFKDLQKVADESPEGRIIASAIESEGNAVDADTNTDDESDGEKVSEPPILVQASGEEDLKDSINIIASPRTATDVDTDIESLYNEHDLEAEEYADEESAWEESAHEDAPHAELPIRNDVSGRRRLLIISRGTRGDVQPFIALGRGLAEQFEWDVYICTEIRYKPLIEKHNDVERGSISYLPSGGDTEARIAKPIAKWAVNTKLRLMQAAMLGRMEREFFDSEPAFFYWAQRLKPDFLCYTFTTANLAFIISEALRIPMIGFFLQPTCLPSKAYTPITPLRQVEDADAAEISAFDLEGHKTFRRIKRLMENNLFTSRLDDMYKRRGLTRKFEGKNDFEVIVDRKFPLVIPIKTAAFGGKPADWPASTHMSDFIFLRTSGVPELTDEVESFIQGAREREYPLMCICFSSMPVTRIKILQSALHILDKCPGGYKPSILALVGNRPDDEQRDQGQETRAEEYRKDKRLLIVSGAPFSKLFPRLDFLVIHGGLGTTAEALASGVPCMVTGVLLLDQRFWGSRIHALGVGPPPVHISDFNDSILDIVPKALAPDSAWKKKAKEVAAEMFPGGNEGMSNGVKENAEVFREVAATAFPAPGAPSSKAKKRRVRRRSRLGSTSSRGSRPSNSVSKAAQALGKFVHLPSPHGASGHHRRNSSHSTMSHHSKSQDSRPAYASDSEEVAPDSPTQSFPLDSHSAPQLSRLS